MSADDTVTARRAALHALDRLVGAWTVQGDGTGGTVRYEWFDNGAFLVQTVDIVGGDGEQTRGVEYIGYDPESGLLKSHYFGSTGEILEYTYDLSGDMLTIWFGGTDSPAKFVGTFDETGDINSGAWEWPGGGYESTMIRVRDKS